MRRPPQRLEAPPGSGEESLPIGVAGRPAEEEDLAGEEGRRIRAPRQLVEVRGRARLHPPVVHEVQDFVACVAKAKGVADRERAFDRSPVRASAGEPETAADRARVKTLCRKALMERVQGGHGERVHVLRRLEPVERDLDLLPPERRERQVLEGELRPGVLEPPGSARSGLARVETGKGAEISDRPGWSQPLRLVDVAEQPGIGRSVRELGGAHRRVGAPGRIPVAVEEADDRPGAAIEHGQIVGGERARRDPSLGKGPAEHLHTPAVAPGDPLDLPDAAPPEQLEAGHRVGEAGEDLHVVVPAHRENAGPGRRQPVHPAAEVPVRLVEVVLLLDDVAREQHRIDLVPKGEVDGEPPRRGRPELARLQFVRKPRGQARGLPAEMDVTDAKKLHDGEPPRPGRGLGRAPARARNDPPRSLPRSADTGTSLTPGRPAPGSPGDRRT